MSATRPDGVAVRLSMQRALLDTVFASLRQVDVSRTDTALTIHAYVHGLVDAEQSDLLTSMVAEVEADFAPEIEIHLQITRCDAPTRCPRDGDRLTVFARAESPRC